MTTKHFLSAFGMETLRDMPDIEALEDAGLLSRKGVHEEKVPTADGQRKRSETVHWQPTSVDTISLPAQADTIRLSGMSRGCLSYTTYWDTIQIKDDAR